MIYNQFIPLYNQDLKKKKWGKAQLYDVYMANKINTVIRLKLCSKKLKIN